MAKQGELQKNSFVICNVQLLRSGELKLSKEQLIFSDDKLCIAVNRSNENHIVHQQIDTHVYLYFGEQKQRGDQVFDRGNLDTSDLKGTLIDYDIVNKKLTVQSDILGTAPIFYYNEGQNLLLSNRLENFARIITGLECDHAAGISYLMHGYTIGENTLYQQVSQTRQEEGLSIKLSSSEPIIKKTASISWHYDCAPADIDKLETLIRGLSDDLTGSVLMSSAGWDSRLLLSIMTEKERSAGYSHGDLESRELRITEKMIQQATSLEFGARSLSSMKLDFQCINEMLEEVGFCLFPYWYRSSEHISRDVEKPISSGVLGELIGGHYGVSSTGSRINKFKSLFSVLLKVKPPAPQNTFTTEELQYIFKSLTSVPKDLWYLTTKHKKELPKLAEKHAERVNALLKHYDPEQVLGPQQVFERFNMEHRARQYILNQSRTSIPFGGYRIPFAQYELVKFALNTAFETRIHNGLNKEVIRRTNKKLLEYPMAATLVNAGSPIILQEFSRVVRIVAEIIRSKLGKSRMRLGWNNFEFLQKDHPLFEQIVNSLKLTIWDYDALKHNINDSKFADPFSMLDMLCKIKAVDYYWSLLDRDISE